MTQKQISAEVLAILPQLKCHENTILRHSEQLTTFIFEELDRILVGIGGKWNTQKQAYIFPFAPNALLAKVIEAKIYPNRKQELQFFPTPITLASNLVDILDINSDDFCLEPSCGTGQIVLQMAKCNPTSIDVCEIDLFFAQFAKDQLPIDTIYQADFLQISDLRKGGYDAIGMNPPFTGNADIHHVRHAFNLLKSNGRLASIMSNTINWKDNRLNDEFRTWAKTVGATWVNNPKKSFAHCGTAVDTITFQLVK